MVPTEVSAPVSCDALYLPYLPVGLSKFLRQWFALPWNSPGQNTGEGSLSLLQGIFPT